MNTSGADIEMRERWRRFDERLSLFVYLISVWIFTMKKYAWDTCVAQILVNIFIRI